ncbi:hypothetical protein pipiens_019783 [Culex pipiens pipiens]|uniref:Nose resistant-to-fluoxetine protein N-terminal domain-containing protein n=1 Tax=Culex pipiens pipiens TaxID=38569 RepID=A0ABD1DTB2_CULPP
MAVLFRPWVLALVTIGLLVCLLTSADGFRLRDFDVDEDQRTTMEASLQEDPVPEISAESKYKFEKVRRSYRASPQQKRENGSGQEQLESGKPTQQMMTLSSSKVNYQETEERIYPIRTHAKPKPSELLFKFDDLPEEAAIPTDPKKVKKLQQTPSKVVKQRIEISPEDFESLLLRIPSFVPDYSRLKNNECRRQGQIFQRQLRGKRLWALQMIDASAKVTSGLLRGNANQLGDYDLCTGIATKVKVKEDEQVRMRGKYCLAHVDVVAEDDDLKLPVHLLQGRGFIKSTLNDVSRGVYES